MDIVLNRQGGVPVRDQLVIQIELKLLTGALRPGEKLPSVRALARRLKLHPNTVSAAYEELETAGRISSRRGVGYFVRPVGPASLEEACGLDEMIRMALHVAFRKGFTGAEIRTAVERWLAAAPPDRIVVVDPAREMGELLVEELRETLGARLSCCTLEDLAGDPGLLSGALCLTLPYHAESVRRLVPGAAVEVITLQVSEQDREAILGLPPDSVALVVSHAPTVIPIASVLLKTLRGAEVLVEARLLSDGPGWRRLVRGADVVFADALSVPAVQRSRPRRLQAFRVVPEPVVGRLREALRSIVPRAAPRRAARKPPVRPQA